MVERAVSVLFLLAGCDIAYGLYAGVQTTSFMPVGAGVGCGIVTAILAMWVWGMKSADGRRREAVDAEVEQRRRDEIQRRQQEEWTT